MPALIAQRRRSGAALAVALALVLAGCGSDGDDGATAITDRPAPPVSDFPPADGKTLRGIAAEVPAAEDIVVSPAAAVFGVGESRFGFGVFTTTREQITDAEVAIYAAPHGGGSASGPFPARIVSLDVEPEFESETTSSDPDAARVVYVSDLRLDRPGNWDVIALVRDGESLGATLVPTIEVGANDEIPAPGERPPAVHTPTVEDVNGDLGRIDTRAPHDDMHELDFAAVLGERPIVLVLATPALCQSRVCGPVVDIAQQVASEHASDDVAFIHMEVYEDNDPNKGVTEPMRAFALPTEPWLFVLDRDGRITTRIEGAFGVSELEAALADVGGPG